MNIPASPVVLRRLNGLPLEEKSARQLEGTSSNESRPINDTLIALLPVLGAVKVFGRLHRRGHGVHSLSK